MTRCIRIAALSLGGALGLFAEANLALAAKQEEAAVKLEARAARHEAKADEMASRKGYNPMAQKWPAMVQGPIDRERQLAANASKEAAKARELAIRYRGGL
jgi:hypothetical protein